MSSDQAPGRPAGSGSPEPDGEPLLPARSQDDTDVGWGEWSEPDEDERYRRDRPPHWETA